MMVLATLINFSLMPPYSSHARCPWPWVPLPARSAKLAFPCDGFGTSIIRRFSSAYSGSTCGSTMSFHSAVFSHSSVALAGFDVTAFNE